MGGIVSIGHKKKLVSSSSSTKSTFNSFCPGGGGGGESSTASACSSSSRSSAASSRPSRSSQSTTSSSKKPGDQDVLPPPPAQFGSVPGPRISHPLHLQQHQPGAEQPLYPDILVSLCFEVGAFSQSFFIPSSEKQINCQEASS